MNVFFSRCLSSGILMVWCAVLTYFYFSGRIASYLHPSFQIYTLLSGVAFGVLSVGLLLSAARGIPDYSHDAPSFLRQIFSTLVLTIPLLIVVVISPSEFGATVMRNRGVVKNITDLPAFSPPSEPALPNEDGSSGNETPVDTSLYLTKTAEGYIKAETADLLYAASEPTMREDFENKEVEVIGQFMPARSENAHDDRFNIVRMFVMCCAADARPVGIAVQTSHLPSFPEMTWVKVTGKAIFPVENGRYVALIIANSVTEVAPPVETFIYN